MHERLDVKELSEVLKTIGNQRCLDYAPACDKRYRSLEMVHAFITGYEYHARVNGFGPKEGWLPVFTAWIDDHYRDLQSTAHGLTLIKVKRGGDDEMAFDEFFRLLSLFENEVREFGLEAIRARRFENLFAPVEQNHARAA